MKPERLSDIKKELRSLNTEQLTDLCLRLAKYKKENKELLSYLLYESENPLDYAETVKKILIDEFQTLRKFQYQSAKDLRKILRTLSKHAKYTASAQVEVELLIWFCTNFIHYADLRSNYKPLQTLFQRQMEKIKKMILKLHDDLQFDYNAEFERLVELADQKIRWFHKDTLLV